MMRGLVGRICEAPAVRRNSHRAEAPMHAMPEAGAGAVAEVTFHDVSKTYADGMKAVSNLSLTVFDGEFFVLVGPSGCGKTTLLRMTAGLESISDGEIRIGGTVVNDLEPKDRDIAMVFQNYALYPHLSVFENIAFGLRARKVPAPQIKAVVEEVAALLGLTQVLKKRPGHLSGGQRQRVAMGRAMVRQPKVYLLDEPLSNLDALLRVQMRAEIARLQRQLRVTTLYVTHDQTEAMTIGDRLAVLKDGELQQVGSPQDVYEQPANAFVARFIGSPSMNIARVTVRERAGQLYFDVGDAPVAIDPRQAERQPRLQCYVDQDVLVGVRPEHIHLSGRGASEHPIRAAVNLVERLGSEALVHVSLPLTNAESEENTPKLGLWPRDVDAAKRPHAADVQGIDFVAKVDAQAQVKAGDQVKIAFDTSRLHAFDAHSGERI